MFQVLHHLVFCRQCLLHRDELGSGVPVEADEEQARVQVAQAIRAVDEVVAAAQDSRALQVLR